LLLTNLFIVLDRCFWEELTTGATIYKNEQVIEHMLVTLTVAGDVL
jgi:hypothetical protein